MFVASKKLRMPEIELHDLILGQTTGVLSALHGVAVAQIGVLDIGQAQGSTTVLVAGEFG